MKNALLSRHWLLLAAIVILTGAARAEDKPLTPAEIASLTTTAAASIVKVEFTLRYDKGDAPQATGWGERCPNCGGIHGFNAESTVKEERPVIAAGFLIGPRKVITSDPQVHPRFLKRLAVSQAGQTVAATIVAYPLKQNALILELAGDLPTAKPLTFNAAVPAPYLAVTAADTDNRWTVSLKPLDGPISRSEGKDLFMTAPSSCLIINRFGAAVALSMKEELPLDESWKGSPDNWPVLTAEDLKTRLDSLQQAIEQTLVRVTLNFRSPKQNGNDNNRYRNQEDDANQTERQVAGIMWDENNLLVLASIPPQVTSRLNRITANLPGNTAIAAKFTGSLSEFGGLLAAPEKKPAATIAPAKIACSELGGQLLLKAELRIQGERRTVYLNHCRIGSFKTGWQGQGFPQVENSRNSSEKDITLFLFDTSGSLLAVELDKRDKVALRDHERWSNNNDSLLVPVELVKKQLLVCDANNRPLAEAEESRLAWLGLDLQPLNRDLARANKISDLTRDGKIGALVSYVYPDSPAGRAGVKPGEALVRLYVEGQPKPVDIKLEERFSEQRDFPWERLDQMPEEYMSRCPRPWPSPETPFTRTLTDLGVGTRCQAEFVKDGQVTLRELVIESGPPHFDASPKYKSELLGVTARDLSYEVRRYFQMTPDMPGVIMSKIEPGSKAAIGGLRPYEIITHINDTPVKNVAELEKLLTRPGEELRLNIKRMNINRIVKLQATAAAAPATPEAGKTGATAAPAETEKPGM